MAALTVPTAFIPCRMGPEELPEVRQSWWTLRRHAGVELPAERNVIWFQGGAAGMTALSAVALAAEVRLT